MKLPIHRLWPVAEGDVMRAEQFANVVFVAPEISQHFSVLQRERQGFNLMIKADEPECAGQVTGGTQNGQGVGCRTEADIPNHEFTGMTLQPFAQPELIDVERLRFGDRSDDGMKGLGIREGTHGADAVVEADELVFAGGTGGVHE